MVQKIESTDNFSREAFTFQSSDAVVIHGFRWIPQNCEIKSVVIINHGMAEHIGCYEAIAAYLCARGTAVWGEDHRGHGQSADSEDTLGHFADKNGWMSAVADIRALFLLVRETYPDLPVLMLGHSMGSFLTRHYISLYGEDLAGAVLMGTAYHTLPEILGGRLLVKAIIAMKGPRYRSPLLDSLSFGQYNRPFRKEGDTGCEWLTRDPVKRAEYKRDPLCGYISTSAFFGDLFTALRAINRKKAFSDTPDTLPLLMISGDRDSLGKNGNGVRKVFNLYRKAGKQDVTLNIFTDFRHDCLNEIDKEKVYKALSDWMEMKVISSS